jgi:4'-phosphopantetheinyl transferase
MDSLELDLQTLSSYLSLKEQEQAEKYAFPYLRRRYIISHGLLRILIEKYTSINPSDIEYTYNKYKKPFLKQSPELYFNMSHSKEYVSYVFSYNVLVGIDIEFINSDIDINNLLSFIASPNEIIDFSMLDTQYKLLTFYKVWTMKESFLKALGIGLTYPLTEIETCILPISKFEISKIKQPINNIFHEINKKWTFVPLEFIPGFLGVVSVNEKDADPYFYNLA